MAQIALLNKILDRKIVAIIRTRHADIYSHLAEALLAGGVTTVEISLTSAQALPAIEGLVRQFGGDMQVGVGSVIDVASAQRAIEVGAQYIVTPVTKPEVIQMARRHGLPIFSGAFSPGEILQAYEMGADVVKVFPAEVLGMAYLKAIKAPMPQLPLMPTGGVTVQNVGEWFNAGACAVGVGSALFTEPLLDARDFTTVAHNARLLVHNCG